MSKVKVDYKKAESSWDLPDGEYEAVICGVRKTKSSKELDMVSLDYEITYGDYAGRFVRYDNVTENAEWKIHAISKCVGFPDGDEYPSLYAWSDHLNGKVIRIKVKTEADRNYPSVKGYGEPLQPRKAAVKKKAADLTPLDEDLPF
jgi:hypothetical protein